MYPILSQIIKISPQIIILDHNIGILIVPSPHLDIVPHFFTPNLRTLELVHYFVKADYLVASVVILEETLDFVRVLVFRGFEDDNFELIYRALDLLMDVEFSMVTFKRCLDSLEIHIIIPYLTKILRIKYDDVLVLTTILLIIIYICIPHLTIPRTPVPPHVLIPPVHGHLAQSFLEHEVLPDNAVDTPFEFFFFFVGVAVYLVGFFELVVDLVLIIVSLNLDLHPQRPNPSPF